MTGYIIIEHFVKQEMLHVDHYQNHDILHEEYLREALHVICRACSMSNIYVKHEMAHM